MSVLFSLLCLATHGIVWSAEMDLPDVIDLTRTMKVDETVYFPELPEGFNMSNVFKGNLLNHGHWVEINRFGMIIHAGTHMDAPCHACEKKKCWRMHEVPFENLRGPAAVLDISAQCEKNATYEMTVEDIENWIKENGAIPDGAIIMIAAGGQNKDFANFWGPDSKNKTYAFPGISPDAVKYLLDKVDFKGVGMDWGGIDSSNSMSLEADAEYHYHAHRALLGNNKLLFEYVGNIHLLPPTGYTIYVNPLKLHDTCGAPSRIIAIKTPILPVAQPTPDCANNQGSVTPIDPPDVIDLALTLKVDETVHFPELPEGFKMANVFRGDVLNHGYWAEINRFGMIIHAGTHMDAPCHVCEKKECWRMHEVPFENLRGPAAVLDISDQCEKNATYEMTVEDIENWIKENGAIPDGAIIMIAAGGQNKDFDNFWGPDSKNKTYAFPGISPDAVKYLLDKVDFKGVGMDWGGIDSANSMSQEADADYHYHAHRALLGNNKMLFEYVGNINLLPATGYTIHVNPLKLHNTCGSPSRMIAIKNPVLPVAQPTPDCAPNQGAVTCIVDTCVILFMVLGLML